MHIVSYDYYNMQIEMKRKTYYAPDMELIEMGFGISVMNGSGYNATSVEDADYRNLTWDN